MYARCSNPPQGAFLWQKVMSTYLDLKITEKDAKYLLEALQTFDEKLATDMAISSNDQEIALLQNDQAYLRILYEELKKRSIQSFGDDILNFDRTPL